MAVRVARIAIVIATLVVSARVHIAADYTLPPPWTDEASFLWPAYAFASNNSLRAPQYNPDRDIFWMPPGYMVIVGTAFKITGLSLEAARWFSWVCTVLSFVMLVMFVGRYPVSVVSTGLLSLFFLSSAAVAIGNVARMDALLLLTPSRRSVYCIPTAIGRPLL